MALTPKQLEEMFKDGRTIHQVVEEFKRNKILTGIMQSEFNIQKASRTLKVSPRTIKYFMVKNPHVKKEEKSAQAEAIPLREILQELEKELLIEALCRCRLNYVHTAKCLGISQRQIYNLFKKWGLKREDFSIPGAYRPKGMDLKAEVLNFEKEIIQMVLDQFKFSYRPTSLTAKFMNVSKKWTRHRIKKLGCVRAVD